MIAMKSIREGFGAVRPDGPVNEVPPMKYSATLDFGAVFGFSQICPGCGSAAIRRSPYRELLHCTVCGAEWGPPSAVSEDVDDEQPR